MGKSNCKQIFTNKFSICFFLIASYEISIKNSLATFVAVGAEIHLRIFLTEINTSNNVGSAQKKQKKVNKTIIFF